MVRKIALLCVVLGLLVLGIEGGFRLLASRMGADPWEIRNMRTLLVTGKMPHFEARAHTVFQRPRTPPNYNTLGFQDEEWGLAGTPGIPRILCLGGSTTEGGNTGGSAASYPRQLESFLEKRTGRDFEVMNAGISGWTSAEFLVSWFLVLQDFHPDLVLIHAGVNDVAPRFKNGFRSDYSHWRVPMHSLSTNVLTRFLARWSDLYLFLRLKRDGVPDIGDLTVTLEKDEPLYWEEQEFPPETALPFRRNIQSIARSARSQGAKVALMTMPWNHDSPIPLWVAGISDNNRILAELASQECDYFIDAALAFEKSDALLAGEFLDLVHLTPKGNLYKAQLAGAALLEQWVAGLEPPDNEAASGNPPPLRQR